MTEFEKRVRGASENKGLPNTKDARRIEAVSRFGGQEIPRAIRRPGIDGRTCRIHQLLSRLGVEDWSGLCCKRVGLNPQELLRD
jgi:hypothetical protein